ncbi:MAG: type II toxin-antitoxin system death-on-curing family toxin [Pseudomonadota bacterium]
MEPKWLTRALVLAIHDEAIAAFGGLPGVRDEGLFEGALDRPKNLLADGDKPSIFDFAASLCMGSVKSHPFLDANKRTGLLSARAFLFLNGHAFEPREADEVDTVVGVADGSVDEAALARWFADFSAKKKK